MNKIRQAIYNIRDWFIRHPNVPAMAIIWCYLIALILLLASCRSTKVVQADRVQKDTITLIGWRYDSVYIDRMVQQEKKNDTVMVKDTKVEYRFKMVRDTVKLVRQDSIPYPVKVTQTKEVRVVPMWAKILAIIGVTALVILCIRIVIRLRK